MSVVFVVWGVLDGLARTVCLVILVLVDVSGRMYHCIKEYVGPREKAEEWRELDKLRLDRLPTELIFHVATMLDRPSLKAFSTVCTRFRAVSLSLLFGQISISLEPPQGYTRCKEHGWYYREDDGLPRRACNGRKIFIPYETRLRQVVKYRNPKLLSRFCGAYCAGRSGWPLKMPLRGCLDSDLGPVYRVVYLDPWEADVFLRSVAEMAAFNHTRELCLSRPGLEEWNSLADATDGFAERTLPKVLLALRGLKTLRLEVGSELSYPGIETPPLTAEFMRSACVSSHTVRPDIDICVVLFWKQLSLLPESIADSINGLSHLASLQLVFSIDPDLEHHEWFSDDFFAGSEQTIDEAFAKRYTHVEAEIWKLASSLIERCPRMQMAPEEIRSQKVLYRRWRWVFLRLGRLESSPQYEGCTMLPTEEEIRDWTETDILEMSDS